MRAQALRVETIEPALVSALVACLAALQANVRGRYLVSGTAQILSPPPK